MAANYALIIDITPTTHLSYDPPAVWYVLPTSGLVSRKRVSSMGSKWLIVFSLPSTGDMSFITDAKA